MIARICLIDLIDQHVGFLDPRSGRGPHVDLDRARVDRGKKVLPEKRGKAERQNSDANKSAGEDEAVLKRQLQEPQVALPKPLEIALEPALQATKEPDGPRLARVFDRRMMTMLMGEQELRHRRHERVGEDVGRDHREHDRHRKRAEEIARHAPEREQRHEGDADAKQGDGRRRHDFLRALGDGRQDVLAMLLHVAVDVLDGDGRVVDEDADSQRKAAERHDVDGLAEQRKRGQGARAPRAGSKR